MPHTSVWNQLKTGMLLAHLKKCLGKMCVYTKLPHAGFFKDIAYLK